MDVYSILPALSMVFVVQSVATFLTNTRWFSVAAYIRNALFAYAFAASDLRYAAFAIIMHIAFSVHKNSSMFVPLFPKTIRYFWPSPLQENITTAYLYNDHFEYFVQGSNPLCSSLGYYTEGSYSRMLGVDTLDLSNENVDRVMAWGQCMLASSSPGVSTFATGDESHEVDPSAVMVEAQNDKFEWIWKETGLKPGDRCLEIGFGKLDLMRYLRKKGAVVTGFNLSNEQVQQATSEGFDAHVIPYSSLAKVHFEPFDLVITNGSLEYVKTGKLNDEESYLPIIEAIAHLLKPGGKWITTTIHQTGTGSQDESAYQPDMLKPLSVLMVWIIMAGNEGGYPWARDALTKLGKRCGLHAVKQENRWLDYFLYSILWAKVYREVVSQMSQRERILWTIRVLLCVVAAPNFLESYLGYTPIRHWEFLTWPWLFQFIRQSNGFTPTTHEWIIFEKTTQAPWEPQMSSKFEH